MRLPITITIARRHLLARLLCRGDVVALVLRADGLLEVERRDGARMQAEVAAETTVFPRLIVLRYRSAGRIASLVLPQVAIGAVGHRRLRVWLNAASPVLSRLR